MSLELTVDGGMQAPLWWRELSHKAMHSIYRFIPTLTYGHELSIVTENTKSVWTMASERSLGEAQSRAAADACFRYGRLRGAAGSGQDTLKRLRLLAGLGTHWDHPQGGWWKWPEPGVSGLPRWQRCTSDLNLDMWTKINWNGNAHQKCLSSKSLTTTESKAPCGLGNIRSDIHVIKGDELV